MIDLETMSLRANAAIISIGAVKFDPDTGKLGETFYQAVDIASYERSSSKYDIQGRTLQWWMSQSDAARAVFEDPAKEHIITSLIKLSAFFGGAIYVWSNGANFDVPILENAYDVEYMFAPWKFYNVRCHRTFKNLVPRDVIELPDLDKGVEHNALDDAIKQAHEVIAVTQYLKGALDDYRDSRQSA